MDAKIGWPSAFVGAVLLLMIGAIQITAVVRYTTVDDALKIWNGMNAVIGVITGAFVSFFFTRGTVQQAQQNVQQAQQQAQQAKQDANEAQDKVDRLYPAFTKLSGAIDPARYEILAADPVVRKALDIG